MTKFYEQLEGYIKIEMIETLVET